MIQRSLIALSWLAIVAVLGGCGVLVGGSPTVASSAQVSASPSQLEVTPSLTPAALRSPAHTKGATPGRDPVSGLLTVALNDLPPEAAATVALIDSGGPFPHDQDGQTFQNREGILPDRPSGYYREYTVETPGSPDRGPRRIVAGSNGELYWTGDHYASFEAISR